MNNSRLTAIQIASLIIGGALLLGLAMMNLTPGHFGFADVDGCTCYVSYTTSLSNPTCELTRASECDQLWIGRLLVYASYLDFNK